jgi:hypothetical protein
MKKVSIKQLAKLLMEEKTVLATHPGGEEGTEGFEKDVLSRSWGDDEEADPKLDFVDESRWADLAGIQEQGRPGPGSATGDTVSDEVYRQAIELFGPSALIDEENGELYIDTGLVDDDIEALYNDWINLWPDAMHEEGGLVYTGIST